MTIPARFKVAEAFTIESRSARFVIGDLVGSPGVRVGQQPTTPANLPPVAAVEFALLRVGGEEKLGLGFAFRSPAERDELARVLVTGLTIEFGPT